MEIRHSIVRLAPVEGAPNYKGLGPRVEPRQIEIVVSGLDERMPADGEPYVGITVIGVPEHGGSMLRRTYVGQDAEIPEWMEPFIAAARAMWGRAGNATPRAEA